MLYDRSIPCLVGCAAQCFARTHALRYCDYPALRQLCRDRSVSADPARRHHLSLTIHRTRKLEQKEWKRTLVSPAACGDWAAALSPGGDVSWLALQTFA